MTKYICITDEDIEKIKNGEVVTIDEDYTAFGMKKVTKLVHENQYDKLKAGELDVDMCINCTKSKYSNQGRPYCAKEERHLDSFNYKPEWCPLMRGGRDE